ncbi:hypothetical protein BV22DRAFT_1051569 [Leucogyrophana mollusca]|uniref:Uncharacterized protein n=1 Tax=Leucogyrophana mollusca TaxID=85980 RepID=A0ACB8B0Q2_9AGAM|nr:hypothetical protein BV22DRAFT_1051569 [Leucogyrophana mollusca]
MSLPGVSLPMVPSALTLPHPGTKQLPKMFKGEYSQVKKFLKHYEKLCDQHRVTLQTEKCENLTQYCSTKVADFIEVLPSYTAKDWHQLKANILEFYDADLDSKHYTAKDLVSFVKSSKEKKIKNLSQWKKYTRDFTMIAGWLLANNKVTADEHATYHWKGIPRILRAKIETRLLAREPLWDMSNPFPVADVTAAARNASKGIDSDADSDSSESSDSEYDQRRSHHKASKGKKSTKGRKLKVSFDSSEDESPPKGQNRRTTHKQPTNKSIPQDEVEDLIQQLNKMSSMTNAMDFCIFGLASWIKQLRRWLKPLGFGNVTLSRILQKVYKMGARVKVMVKLQMFRLLALSIHPGSFDNQDVLAMGNLLTKGSIVRNNCGQLAMPNGQPLRRQGDETFLQAYQHETKTSRTHLVMTEPAPERWVMPDDDDDDLEESVYVVPSALDYAQDSQIWTYPVERNEKGMTHARQDCFNAMYPPPLSEIREQQRDERKARERRAEEQGKRSEETQRRAESTTKETGTAPPAPRQQYLLLRPDFNPRDDDAIMEDVTNKQPAESKRERDKPKVQKDAKVPQPGLEPHRNYPRKSEISANVDSKKVLDRLLSTPVQVAVGELLGVSKELSGVLSEAMKPKSALEKSPRIEAHSVWTKTRSLLIRLLMHCDNRPITAIIDTGSQLNIDWLRLIKTGPDQSYTRPIFLPA